MRIADRVFLITGGSSGLGAACGRHLAGLGAKIVLADVNPAVDAPADALFVAADVTQEVSVQATLDAALAKFGRVDAVVQCAGVVHAEKVLGRSGAHDLQTFTRVLTINVIGTFNVMRLSAGVLARNEPGEDGERGVIVNTSSVAAFEGQIGQAAYAASKGAVASMTLPIARELASKGIRVAAIAPGIFDTPMLQGMPEPVRKSLGEQVPFPSRLGQPEEFASLVQHICENRMLNGCVIRLDGAIRMSAK